ncbi:MAG TPA: tetratricopeptide repeat protein [bacterium]|nr:tetratricopeptide repeat protein [bacterium]
MAAGNAPDLTLQTRQALEHLTLGAAKDRAEALVWLAEHGTMAVSHPVSLRLKDDDPAIRELAEQVLWAIWTRSGDPQTDQVLEQGAKALADDDYAEALERFDQVVQRQPDFAEGYNKRATTLYLMGDYLRALDDVETTVKLNPDHFGALSGGGLCMLKLGRPAEALFYFERALQINPNMEGIRQMAEQLRNLKPRPLI